MDHFKSSAGKYLIEGLDSCGVNYEVTEQYYRDRSQWYYVFSFGERKVFIYDDQFDYFLSEKVKNIVELTDVADEAALVQNFKEYVDRVILVFYK
jgi:hypothetical protein